jgi:hypothetical protein
VGSILALCAAAGVRGLEERFESRVRPLFKLRTEEVGELLPQPSLHGLAARDFELALRGLFSEGAPLSPSSIARLKKRWLEEYREWRPCPLEGELAHATLRAHARVVT